MKVQAPTVHQPSQAERKTFLLDLATLLEIKGQGFDLYNYVDEIRRYFAWTERRAGRPEPDSHAFSWRLEPFIPYGFFNLDTGGWHQTVQTRETLIAGLRRIAHVDEFRWEDILDQDKHNYFVEQYGIRLGDWSISPQGVAYQLVAYSYEDWPNLVYMYMRSQKGKMRYIQYKTVSKKWTRSTAP